MDDGHAPCHQDREAYCTGCPPCLHRGQGWHPGDILSKFPSQLSYAHRDCGHSSQSSLCNTTETMILWNRIVKMLVPSAAQSRTQEWKANSKSRETVEQVLGPSGLYHGFTIIRNHEKGRKMTHQSVVSVLIASTARSGFDSA